MANLNLQTPNMRGRLYIGEPMATEPTSLTDFEWNVTELQFGTTDVQIKSEAEKVSNSFYGSNQTIEMTKSVKDTVEFTQLLTVDTTEGSYYMRFKDISIDPQNTDFNRVSYYFHEVDPVTGVPFGKAVFVPEAEVGVSNVFAFGKAGEFEEQTITLSNVSTKVIMATPLTDAPAPLKAETTTTK
jgi:hypothetical protein